MGLTNRAPLIAAIALLLMIYVGSYFALVQQGPVRSNWHECRAEYRLGGTAATYFFAPVHDVDRRLRRWVWGSLRERLLGSPWQRWWSPLVEENSF
jgi:hypothetical protein